MDATDLLPTPRNVLRSMRWSFDLWLRSQQLTCRVMYGLVAPLLPPALRRSIEEQQTAFGRTGGVRRPGPGDSRDTDETAEPAFLVDAAAAVLEDDAAVLEDDAAVLEQAAFVGSQDLDAASDHVVVLPETDVVVPDEVAAEQVVEPIAELPPPEPADDLLPVPRPSHGAEQLVEEAGVAPADASESPVGEPDETTGGDSGDDLTLINGIGPRMAERLAHQGITTFAQLAAWGDEDIAHFEEHLPGVQRGRAAREGWVEQARTFANSEA